MRTLPFVAVLVALSFSACNRPKDSLEPFRETCRGLLAKQELKPGLTLELCAKSLFVAAEAADPARRAEELTERIEGLVKQGKSGAQPAQRLELRDAVSAVQGLGKPAVGALMKRLTTSQDSDVRMAVAKALVGICSEDCAQEKFDCIVPALLQGFAEGLPSEVSLETARGLTRCTGQGFGNDAKAWREWWAGLKPGH